MKNKWCFSLLAGLVTVFLFKALMVEHRRVARLGESCPFLRVAQVLAPKHSGHTWNEEPALKLRGQSYTSLAR